MRDWQRVIRFGRLLLLVSGALLSAAVGLASAAAEEGFVRPVTRAEVLDVARELYPPGSTDNVLADYSTWPTAVTLRAEIAQLLSEGRSKPEVIERLVAKYGEEILAAPPQRGRHLLIWYLPYTMMALSALGLLVFLRRRTRPAVKSPAGDPRPAEGSEAIPAQTAEAIRRNLREYL